MEQTPDEQRKTTLKELTGKSWNLELIISGASIVLTTYLPTLVDEQFYYFQYNISTNWSGGDAHLPILAYAFFKTVAWLLTGMFVAHLVTRAFWVALVGMQAAYPQGIQYDKVPNVPDVIKKVQEKEFGTLENYIIRLDKLCNQMLALAFLIFLMGALIGVMYYLYFYIVQFGRVYIPEAWQDPIGMALIALALALTGAFMLVTYLAKKPENEARYGKFAVFIYRVFQNGFLPFLRRPVQYLTLTFTTNMPKKRYYVRMIFFFSTVMGTVMMVFMHKMGELRSSHMLEFHRYYSSGSQQSELVSERYDNLRPPGAPLPLVSLASDVVEEPFLKVYVVYPKMVDERLARLCAAPPSLSHDIPRYIRQERADSAKLDCLNRFFQLYINDSLYAQPGWVYHQKPDAFARGLLAYLRVNGLKAGKNTITVMIPSESKPDSLELYGKAPFWVPQ